MKNVYCINLGCGENKLDGLLINNYFQENDWELMDNPQEADLIIVNSCGFTNESEQRSIDAYRKLESIKRADARIIFAGCLPAINKKAIKNTGYNDVCVTPRTLYRFDSVINADTPIDPEVNRGCVPFNSDSIDAFASDGRKKIIVIAKRIATVLKAIPYFPVPRWLWQFLYFPDKNIEYVRISVGCMNNCTFCAIPMAKGKTKSVPIPLVLRQVKDALKRGKISIALSCDELGSYGQDLGTDVVSLLDQITNIHGDFNLILRNVHPEWILRYWDGLKPIFAGGKIAFMTLPLQSGSDTILKSMKRNHTTEEYRWLISEIRKAAPKLIIRTHILLGFPGETEGDFQETYNFIKTLPVDLFYAHQYSERSVTPSAKMPEKVSESVARERISAIKNLYFAQFFQAFRWFPMRP